jgi:hypothetical protein
MKKVFSILNGPFDLLFAVVAFPAALTLSAYRRIGSRRLRVTTRMLKAIGVFPVIDHYYEPLFNDAHLTKPLSDDRDLPGIDFDLAGQLSFLGKLGFASELIEMKLDNPRVRSSDFSMMNPTFGPGDADFLYQFIRATKPRKVVEIGSGNSTRLACIALLKNYSESKFKAPHTCIEPYEMSWLEELTEVEVIRKRVEDCNFDWSKELSSGDLLFVDSSHVIRPQSDVLKEYLEIIPMLASGVYVHVHDIFTPKDYSRGHVIEDVRFWNEQYLLETLLSNTARYRIVAALNYLKHHNFDELNAVCPYLTENREPGSFYFQVR